jgi:hypothetical protein
MFAFGPTFQTLPDGTLYSSGATHVRLAFYALREFWMRIKERL